MSTNGQSASYEQQIAALDRELDALMGEERQVAERIQAVGRRRERLAEAAAQSGPRRCTMSDAQKSQFIRNYPGGPEAGLQAYLRLPWA